jgi:pimeloyl-ACP methyl ester carboxylesterase
MARAAAQCGYEAVTFDLRGAGDSSGRCSFRCKSEAGDARAVVAHLLSERVSERVSEEEGGGRGVFLVGSSAGAAVAGSVLDFSPRVLGGLFVGYTWGWAASLLFGWAFHSLECSTKPKLFVVGTADEFTSMAQYEWRLRGLAGSLNRMEVIEGKNHFQIEAPVYDEFVVQQAISFLETITTTQGEVSE